MGLFGPTRVTCPAGQWTTIIKTSFAQIPVSFTVRLQGPVAGEFEETKSRWIFRGTGTRGALAETMVFERGYWNTFYSVRVCPRHDVTAIID